MSHLTKEIQEIPKTPVKPKHKKKSTNTGKKFTREEIGG
jgi:hypothetical protein